MYQRVVIVGNLGGDPDLKYTASGTAVAKFSVATSERYKDKEGEAQQRTTWFRVSAWGRLGEVCNEFLRKGSKCLVEGRIQTSTFTDKDGVERHGWELRADSVQFLDPKGSGGGGGQDDDEDPFNDDPF